MGAPRGIQSDPTGGLGSGYCRKRLVEGDRNQLGFSRRLASGHQEEVLWEPPRIGEQRCLSHIS